MENLDLIALLIEHGPTLIGFLVGLFIPADKLPILKDFLNKTSSSLDEDKESE